MSLDDSNTKNYMEKVDALIIYALMISCVYCKDLEHVSQYLCQVSMVNVNFT